MSENPFSFDLVSSPQTVFAWFHCYLLTVLHVYCTIWPLPNVSLSMWVLNSGGLFVNSELELKIWNKFVNPIQSPVTELFQFSFMWQAYKLLWTLGHRFRGPYSLPDSILVVGLWPKFVLVWILYSKLFWSLRVWFKEWWGGFILFLGWLLGSVWWVQWLVLVWTGGSKQATLCHQVLWSECLRIMGFRRWSCLRPIQGLWMPLPSQGLRWWWGFQMTCWLL